MFYVKVDFKGKERDCASLALLCIREFSKEKRILCFDVYPLTLLRQLDMGEMFRCKHYHLIKRSLFIWLTVSASLFFPSHETTCLLTVGI